MSQIDQMLDEVILIEIGSENVVKVREAVKKVIATVVGDIIGHDNDTITQLGGIDAVEFGKNEARRKQRRKANDYGLVFEENN